jgi:hypothetical protein
MIDPLALGIPGEYSAAMLTLFFLEKIIVLCKLQIIIREEFSSSLSKHLFNSLYVLHTNNTYILIVSNTLWKGWVEFI